MYAAMHKISTQLLQCTKCRIKDLEQAVIVAVALSVIESLDPPLGSQKAMYELRSVRN